MEIGFYLNVFNNRKASIGCIESVRKFYPTAPIYVNNDKGEAYSAICDKYICKYNYCDRNLGYPVQPYGYNVKDAVEWLDRVYKGLLYLQTDYFMMLEDDVLLVKKLTIDPSWQMAGHPFLYENQVPEFPQEFVKILENYSKRKILDKRYNCGGGSIFRTENFLNNYESFRTFLLHNMKDIQFVYPTLGWLDCLMCVFYLTTGAKVVENKKLFNNFPVKKPFDFEMPKDIEIIHNFKDNYE